MASYGGKTVAGSDGSDHLFRERVASQYQTSAKNKSTLKTLLLLSFLPNFIIVFHILQVHLKIKLLNEDLPPVETWEYVYLLSPFITLVGYTSLQKNKATLLSIYIYSAILFVVLPVLYKGFINCSNPPTLTLFNIPIYIVNSVFVVLVTGMHLYSLICASRLVNAWKQKGYKSK